MYFIFDICIHVLFGFIIYFIVFYNVACKLEKTTIAAKEERFYAEISEPKYPNTNVVALVFFSIKKKEIHSELVSKYLMANLKSNGGILNKIVFGVQTNRFESIKYLREAHPNEVFVVDTVEFIKKNYPLIDEKDFVFKVNENIVFISNKTLTSMVEEHLAKNNDEILSANVISDSIMFKAHLKIGAIKPFSYTIFDNWMVYDQTNHLNLKVCEEKWHHFYRCSSLVHENFFYNFNLNSLDVYNFGRWIFNEHKDNFILLKGFQLKRKLYDPKKGVIGIGDAVVSCIEHFDKERNLLKRYIDLASNYI